MLKKRYFYFNYVTKIHKSTTNYHYQVFCYLINTCLPQEMVKVKIT